MPHSPNFPDPATTAVLSDLPAPTPTGPPVALASADPSHAGAGRYELLALLGEGGVARVYRARDTVLDRIVAVKVLRPARGVDREFVARLAREAQTIASLDHPNVVAIYDYGAQGGIPFLALQYVEGTDLKALLRREGPLAPARVLAIVDGVLAALGAAHAQGIIHRDVKPQNILVGPGDETVKLTDFGIARALAGARGAAGGGRSRGADRRRHRDRHRRLHGPGAGGRRGGRPRHRPLRGRGCPLRGADGSAALLRR